MGWADPRRLCGRICKSCRTCYDSSYVVHERPVLPAICYSSTSRDTVWAARFRSTVQHSKLMRWIEIRLSLTRAYPPRKLWSLKHALGMPLIDRLVLETHGQLHLI